MLTLSKNKMIKEMKWIIKEIEVHKNKNKINLIVANQKSLIKILIKELEIQIIKILMNHKVKQKQASKNNLQIKIDSIEISVLSNKMRAKTKEMLIVKIQKICF